jgi:hypothetical protein
LVLDLTSIVDTDSLRKFVTKAVLPSGVNANPTGVEPTAMSVPTGVEPTAMSAGFFVLLLTSIVDTVPLSALVTNAVARHRERATADTPPGDTPTSAPANPNTTTPRTHRNHRTAATPSCDPLSSRLADQGRVRRTWVIGSTKVPPAPVCVIADEEALQASERAAKKARRRVREAVGRGQ